MKELPASSLTNSVALGRAVFHLLEGRRGTVPYPGCSQSRKPGGLNEVSEVHSVKKIILSAYCVQALF